jgi:hypothetical protein
MSGSEYRTSTARISTSSMRPPKYPAMAPYVMPITKDMSVDTRPTIKLMRLP